MMIGGVNEPWIERKNGWYNLSGTKVVTHKMLQDAMAPPVPDYMILPHWGSELSKGLLLHHVGNPNGKKVALGQGNKEHTIVAYVGVPLSMESGRHWILNVGQMVGGDKHCHHWLIKKDGDDLSDYQFNYQLGSWNGEQIRDDLGLTRGCKVWIATTFDGSEIKCYVKGELVGTVDSEFDFPEDEQEVNTETPWGGDLQFEGAVSVIGIWNRALNPEEIAEFCDR